MRTDRYGLPIMRPFQALLEYIKWNAEIQYVGILRTVTLKEL
jgi:hypothetical protein